jgi:DNA (cytosine-5)-methyltransferase 1
MTLTVGSLFSGIGGFDLGLERAGMKVIWQSEIDQFASKVLKKHWPDVPNLGDITKVDWSKIERPDVICGGYPCQPFSTAGKRGGTDDPRHLWPAMHNAICVLRPRYALMENVRGHLSLGFSRVLGDLAEIGYDAEWEVIPAAAVGAPHKRDRVFIVAYPNNAGVGTHRRKVQRQKPSREQKRQIIPRHVFSRRSSEMADTNSRRCQECQSEIKSISGFSCRCKRKFVANADSEFLGQYGSSGDVANESRQRHDQRERQKTNDIGQWWEVEPNVGRVANGVSDRVDRLRGLGNAIVPQVAELVGALVIQHANID